MGQGEHLAWYYEPVWIALLTLFAMGPFSLPMIWKTPKLSERGKWIGTGLLALYTIFIVKGLITFMRTVSAVLTAASNLGG